MTFTSKTGSYENRHGGAGQIRDVPADRLRRHSEHAQKQLTWHGGEQDGSYRTHKPEEVCSDGHVQENKLHHPSWWQVPTPDQASPPGVLSPVDHRWRRQANHSVILADEPSTATSTRARLPGHCTRTVREMTFVRFAADDRSVQIRVRAAPCPLPR